MPKFSDHISAQLRLVYLAVRIVKLYYLAVCRCYGINLHCDILIFHFQNVWIVPDYVLLWVHGLIQFSFRNHVW